jgi:hypothetical protein
VFYTTSSFDEKLLSRTVDRTQWHNGDPSSQICKDKEEDAIIKKLQALHNMAMRAAALDRGEKDRTSCSILLSLIGQTSVGEMCRIAVSQAAKIHIGLEIEGRELPLTGGRLIWPQRTRMTRNLEKGLLPARKLSGTLLAAMATVRNGLPEAIKSEQSETKCKKNIVAFCSNLQKINLRCDAHL